MPPSLPDAAREDVDDELMPSIHRVIAYSGLDYHSALELPVDVFMAMVRASLIEELSKTEEGVEYMKKCERLKKTDLDEIGLNEFKEHIERGE